MNLNEIINNNKDFLQGEPNVYFSPGRVNLIGEHIDYLGGNVFPSGISLGTYAFVTKRDDDELHFISENFKDFGVKVASLKDLTYKKEDNWTNFAKGMFEALIKEGADVKHGLNILVYGTLPNSSGLSSSASLEVLIGEVIKEEYNFEIEMFDMVQIAQKVENDYIGVNCGIMDQFAVGMSKENTAIYLNTNTLEYKYVPLDLGEFTLVIANTNRKRALADSKYNERRSECDKGLSILQSNNVDINQLCEMTSEVYENNKSKIKNFVVRNRVEHAVYENERTVNAVKALEEGKILKMGQLMNQSHNSLRDLYEVSCKELDVLVDYFRKNGAIGARMTGAGFGGCAIALVPTLKVEKVIEEVKKSYLDIIGYHASFYAVKTSDGTKKINLEVR